MIANRLMRGEPEPVLPSALAEQQRRTCRVLVAAAGYGKSTALHRWFPAPGSRWAAPRVDDHLVRLIVDAAGDGAREIVVDDLPRLPAELVHRVVDAVAALPDTVTVVLSSRWPLAVPAARWLGRGLWTELGPADLALCPDEVAALLVDEYGLADPDLAEQVHDATAGWPALVHLAAETVRMNGPSAGPLVPAITEPGGPLAAYLAEEVLSGLPADVIRLIRHVGDLAPVSAGLCEALGHRRAAGTVRLLSRTGLLTRTEWPPALPGCPPAITRIVPVVAEVVRQRARRAGGHNHATAAQWYEEHGPPEAAARAYRQAGDDASCARVLGTHGESMVTGGQAEALAELVAVLPEELRTRRLRLLHGDALRTLGELGAAAVYEAVAATEPDWDAALAWRIGRIHHQRGNTRAALEAFARGPVDSPPTADTVLLLAWTAVAHLLAGDTELATTYARRALALGPEVGHGGALAAAHLSAALCAGMSGDTAASEEHYALARPIAERTGDVLLLARIFTNRTYHLLRTGQFATALVTAQQSARYAAAARSPSLRAIATSNEADALAHLGRYDEAEQRYELALSRYQRKGSRRYAGARLGLAEVYRRRGWREQARAAYEEVIRVAEETGNVHVLVPALAGLALVVLDDDPKAAATHAEQAERHASEEVVVPALLAQGWVALHDGDRARAGDTAAEAARLARAQRDRAALADALELRAATETDPARVREALREAYAIWAETGAVIEAARIQVALGHLTGAGTDDRLNGLLAAEHLVSAGVRAAAPESTVDSRGVAIQALGRFEVHLGGRAVPASSWQSRKARDLLKILVARRGRPIPRGELCELLWPDDDQDKTGHRLSVLLSIVRGVLDPAKAFAADHFLVADQASIALDIARVRVDVEDFLAQVAHGRRLVDRGALVEARTLLLAADRQYRADAFEDEPYADWSGPLREEARAAYLSMLRMLAQSSRVVAGPGAAVGYLLRLLERDPYDEAAHRALVRSLVAGGQHGEARRAFQRYGDAMRTIGVRPPDEVVLVPARPDRPR